MFTRAITSRLTSPYLLLSIFYYLHDGGGDNDVALFECRSFCDVSPFVTSSKREH